MQQTCGCEVMTFTADVDQIPMFENKRGERLMPRYAELVFNGFWFSLDWVWVWAGDNSVLLKRVDAAVGASHKGPVVATRRIAPGHSE